jgi:heme/copper-type cytochrome/quinol oxidase subunit 2
MAVAFILLLVAVASVLFHLFSPWWWTPLASNWGYIDDTITLTFWITGAVFSAVVVFMAYCVFRFRHKEGRQAAYNPENNSSSRFLPVPPRSRSWDSSGCGAIGFPERTAGSGLPMPATSVPIIRWD